MNYQELIDSKIRSGRPKDLLDIQELERIRKNHSRTKKCRAFAELDRQRQVDRSWKER